MGTLADLLGNYAPGHALEHGRRRYVFSRIDQAAKAALSVAYFERARKAVYAIRDEVEPGDYDRQLKAALDDYRRGLYAFTPGSECFAYFVGAGLDELVRQLTGCTPGEAHGLIEAMPVEVLHVCLCVVYESLGEPDKKKLRAQGATAPGRALAELLSAARTSNGSPSPTPTTPRASPSTASAPTASPDSPTSSSTASTITPETRRAD